MMYSEIIADCSEIHTKHINTLCGQNGLNVKRSGTYNNHWALEGLRRVRPARKLYPLDVAIHQNDIPGRVFVLVQCSDDKLRKLKWSIYMDYIVTFVRRDYNVLARLEELNAWKILS
jgi:hypothetical protein